jgi:DNA-binding MarR family transcriptional regulator
MMTITEVMNLRAISSPATLHRKLHNLVKAGLIELKFDKNNNRTKYVMLTKKTFRYYEKIDALMLKSIQ